MRPCMKLVSVLIAVALSIALCPTVALASNDTTPLRSGYSLTTQAASKTADEAVGWAKSQVGKHVGKDDGSGYYQCVEFIQAYYVYLGYEGAYGNGSDYAQNALPDAGWTRTAGGTPQKGDILVYSGSPGHVAIYESDNSLYDQDGSKYLATVEHHEANYRTYTPNYWGCIHPNFASDENPIAVTAVNKSIKASALKSAAKKVAPFAVTKAAASYAFKDAGSDKYLAIASDGKVTVKKGTPAGSYKARATVHADGNAQYRAKDVQVEATIEVVSTAATYKVRFFANGGRGAMGAQTVERGKTASLKPGAFKRSGYKFTGWNTRANGKGKSYKDKAKVRNLAKAGETVKLYAQWKKSTSYTIKTSDYSVTIPKAWRGKVDWQLKPLSYRYTDNCIKKELIFYLKGHKGDFDYALAFISVPTGGGFGHCTQLYFYNHKTDGSAFFDLSGVVTPYKVWAGKHEGDWSAYHDISISDQKKMLELTTGGKVSYKSAIKDYSATSANNYAGITKSNAVVSKYMKKLFRGAVKSKSFKLRK